MFPAVLSPLHGACGDLETLPEASAAPGPPTGGCAAGGPGAWDRELACVQHLESRLWPWAGAPEGEEEGLDVGRRRPRSHGVCLHV